MIGGSATLNTAATGGALSIDSATLLRNGQPSSISGVTLANNIATTSGGTAAIHTSTVLFTDVMLSNNTVVAPATFTVGALLGLANSGAALNQQVSIV